MRKSKTPPNNLGTYISSIVFNGIFLFVINKIPEWNPAFITESFADVVWILNASIIVQLIGNGLLILFHPLFFHHLVNLLFSVVSFIAVYRIFRVFPFDFSMVKDWLITVVRIVLVSGMVGTVIACVVHLLGFLTAQRGKSGE